MAMRCRERLEACVIGETRKTLENYLAMRPFYRRRLLRVLREEGYKSHEWQHLKRIIADPVVKCIIEFNSECFNGCLEEVYIADLTGGQHSYYNGHGGKDLDIILKLREGCKRHETEEGVERSIEEAVSFVLEELFGQEFHKLLGIPNIIEIHVVDGPDCFPYYQLVKSKSPTLLRVWPSTGEGQC